VIPFKITGEWTDSFDGACRVCYPRPRHAPAPCSQSPYDPPLVPTLPIPTPMDLWYEIMDYLYPTK